MPANENFNVLSHFTHYSDIFIEISMCDQTQSSCKNLTDPTILQ